MGQIPFDEVLSLKGADFSAAGIAVFPAEGDVLLGDLKDAGVVDGGACDVSSEVEESRSTRTDRLDVHAPVLAPGFRIGLPAMPVQEGSKLLTKGGLQVRKMDQELGVADANEFTLGIKSGSGHQEVEVRMEEQALVPGVKDGGEAVSEGLEPLGGAEFCGECARRCGEEEVVGFLGMGAKEAGPEFGRQGEGDQEVGSVNEFAEFTLNPVGGGRTATLGTSLVVAGMPGELEFTAGSAGKGVAAQSRGPAMGESPNGASLILTETWNLGQERRQELTQRAEDGAWGSHGGEAFYLGRSA